MTKCENCIFLEKKIAEYKLIVEDLHQWTSSCVYVNGKLYPAHPEVAKEMLRLGCEPR